MDNNSILEKFNNGEFNAKSFKEIVGALGLETKEERRQLGTCLSALEKDELIIFSRDKYYINSDCNFNLEKNQDIILGVKKNDSSEFITGIVRCNEKGFGFLQVENHPDDYFIPPRKMGNAFQGDKVLAKRVKSSRSDDEVEVVKVISHEIQQLCGTFYSDYKVDFVRPDDRGYLYDIIISNNNLNAQDYDKVLVKITDFPKGKNPQGEVLRVIGKSLELATEEETIILSNEIKQEFDKKTLEEAEAIPEKVQSNQLIGRLDLRNKIIFTIDGETARDFDDAVSLEINEKGNYILGVHIADVSNYVTPESSLGKEAFERATSVYLPDKVIPMLPFALSNGICSLNEGVDRLTLSVIAEIDKDGNTIENKFYKSIICSKRRLTYTQVQKMIENDAETCKEFSDVVDVIREMKILKIALENKKAKAGEIDLSVKEADVFMQDGKISVSEHKSNDATNLIEQFMIYANEAVAEYLSKLNAPCVYRVHDKPSYEKIESFKQFLFQLGIRYELSGEKPIEYKLLLDKLKGEKTYASVNKMMLRSMQKAEYSPQNIGHFGLASKCYLHFTSPIRRFPDLVVHRILKDIIDGKKQGLNDLYGNFVVKAAENSSKKERLAELCERDVDDAYKVVYMKDYIGKEFDGIISGVTNFGFFVELENTIEGIVRIENLPRGNYQFDESRMRLYNGKLSFSLCESVHIGVLDANLATRKIEFAYISKKKNANSCN